MKTAHQVAQFFLHHAYDGERDQISNLKLQKLLYYTQGYALSLLDRPLFAEPIKCWKHDPVIESVYYEYKSFGKSFIKPAESERFDLSIFNADELAILTRVAHEYGQYSAWKLRDMTHDEAPWCHTYYSDATVIAHLDIQQFFKGLLSTSQNYDDHQAYQYDVNAMQASIDSGSVTVPDFETGKDFIAWLNA